MIHISLRPDNSIKKIDYSHYGKKCILRDEVAVIKENLNSINREFRFFQDEHCCFKSERHLNDEILYAQFKYIEGIQCLGRCKRPESFRFMTPTIYITYNSDTGECVHDKEREKGEKEALYLERMTEEEFWYYLSWRTRILDREPVRYEEDLMYLIEKEFIYGTIDNSKRMLNYICSICEFGSSVFREIFQTIEEIKGGMKPYIEEKYKRAAKEPWDHFVWINECYKGNYDNRIIMNYCEMGICEYIRYGTGYSFPSSYCKKYPNLKSIIIQIFDSSISGISMWAYENNIPFNEWFIAKKKPRELLINISEECLFRIYNDQEMLFTYDDSCKQIREFRLLLLMLFESTIRKRAHFNRLNRLDDQILICKQYLKSPEKEELLDSLANYIDIVVDEIIDSKYKNAIDEMKTNQIKLHDKLHGEAKSTSEKRVSPRDRFIQEVKNHVSYCRAVTLFKSFSDSAKKSNRALFYTVLFGLWVIDSEDDYNNFVKLFGYDKNYIIAKNSLLKLDSVSFLKYIIVKKQIYLVRMSQQIDNDTVNAYIVQSYYLFYLICAKHGLSPIELLVGTPATVTWQIFGGYIDNDVLQNRNIHIRKKLFDLFEYTVLVDKCKITSEIKGPVESKLSDMLIKDINTHIQKYILDLFNIPLKGLSSVLTDYSEFIDGFHEPVNTMLKDYYSELAQLLETIFYKGIMPSEKGFRSSSGL